MGAVDSGDLDSGSPPRLEPRPPARPAPLPAGMCWLAGGSCRSVVPTLSLHHTHTHTQWAILSQKRSKEEFTTSPKPRPDNHSQSPKEVTGKSLNYRRKEFKPFWFFTSSFQDLGLRRKLSGRDAWLARTRPISYAVKPNTTIRHGTFVSLALCFLLLEIIIAHMHITVCRQIHTCIAMYEHVENFSSRGPNTPFWSPWASAHTWNTDIHIRPRNL